MDLDSSAILPAVLLSLSVPAMNARGPLYMEQALAAIHQGNPHRLPLTFSFGRHGDTVTLLCRCPDKLAAVVEGQLYAQYPDCKVERLPDDALAPPTDHAAATAEMRLEPELFPCKRYGQFEDTLNRQTADPLTAILLTLARDKQNLRSLVEIVIYPASGKRRTRAANVLRRFARPFFRSHHRLAHLYLAASLSPSRSLRLCGWLLGRLAATPASHGQEDALHTSGSRLHEREEELQAGADKLGKLLFEARIRVTVFASSAAAAGARSKLAEIAGAFGQFSIPRLASFHVRPTKRRFPRCSPTFLLSTEEVATLWHPPTLTVRAPTMRTVESREFEPPVALPLARHHPELAVLGTTLFRGRRERFGILPDDRRRHLAVLGKTGMGKSTLLQRLIASDIAAGRGVALIDPHGDLTEALVSAIPRHRTNDVILFDAGDRSYPLAFNVLACSQAEQRPLVASGILSAFKKLYGDSWGPRLEHILRNALLTLLDVPGTSLVSLLRLLGEAPYRQALVAQVRDPAVRSFWEKEFALMHPKLQVEAIAPVQNKVGHFVSSPLLRNIVGQARSTLNLRKVMDEGKVLLVNLSKGRIGDDASMLLGSLLVTSLQLAAMSRAEVPESQRRDFFLYVDEFQNFSTDSFPTILSEARKYRLSITLANQYLAQLEDGTLHALFGNVGTLVVFQVGAEDAEILGEQLGGDVQKADLLTLPRYQACVRLLTEGMPSRPFSMQTLPPRTGPADPDRPAIIRRTSRQRYARPAETVEREIAEAFAG